MEHRKSHALRRILYGFDAIAVSLSLLLAFLLQSELRGVFPFLKGTPHYADYAQIGILALIVWLALVPLFDLQKIFDRPLSGWQLFARLVKHHLAGLVILALVVYLGQSVINRSLVLLFLACTFTLMFTVRAILGFRMKVEWRHGHARPNILLAGAPGPAMTAFVTQLDEEDMSPRIAGRVSAGEEEDGGPEPEPGTPERLGSIDRLADILHETPADQVLFFPPLETPAKAEGALNVCENLGIPARFAVDLTQPGLAAPQLISLYDTPFITFEAVPRREGLLALKHGLDAAASFLGLVLLLPLLAVVGAAILVTMGRPVLFAQERAGLFGRTFRMLKFRTMVKGAEKLREDLADANEMDGPVFKISDDPRVTRLGRFLRRSSIDELPQLINVIGGTMSLVGPRPLPTVEQQDIRGWHRRRLSMKPGITGLWQVSGRNHIDFEDWMKLDLRYVDTWSLGLDASIMLRTVKAVITKSGAS